MDILTFEKKDELLLGVRNCLCEIINRKIFRISPRRGGNECDLPYKAVYISKYIHHPWVSICWSECFEKIYKKDNTPFWIEFDEGTSQKLLLKELDKDLIIRVQPVKKDRKIIPVSIQNMFIPMYVAQTVFKLAENTL